MKPIPAVILFLALQAAAYAQAQYQIPTLAIDSAPEFRKVLVGQGGGVSGTFVLNRGSMSDLYNVSVSYSGSSSLVSTNWGINGGRLVIYGSVNQFAPAGTYQLASITFLDGFPSARITYNRDGSITGNTPSAPRLDQRHNLDFSRFDITAVQSLLPISFTSSPTSTQVSSGSAIQLRWDFTGDGPVEFYLEKNGQIVPFPEGSPRRSSNTTAFREAVNKSRSATIDAASIADAGTYRIVAEQSYTRTQSYSNPFTIGLISTPPVILSQPVINSGTPAPSGPVLAKGWGTVTSISATATGTPAPTFQWFKDGTAIAGATSSRELIQGGTTAHFSELVIRGTTTLDAGIYTVRVSNNSGSVTSSPAVLSITAPWLSNLSVRTTLDSNQVLIVGMTMSGGSKNVLLRAVGPTLSVFGVTDAMSDPKLDLYSGASRVASNDNWQGIASLANAFLSVGAFSYSTSSSLDAALTTSIEGGRTMHVSGPTAGTVLVEGYDAGSGPFPRFSNLSARNKVGTGSNILIAGFTLSGGFQRNILIRAIGPKLADFGVAGVLQDPKLQIFQGSTRIAENDNWAPSLAPTFTSVGAFGLTAGSKDAAIVIRLERGSYTVQVSGANGGTGEAIVEIYELP